MRNNHWTITGICAGLVALVWFVFGQTIWFPYINFDDPEYVYEVPEINSGLTFHNVAWAFTHWPSTNWFPLKNISHMIEFQFLGFNPGAFHLTNVFLHAVSALLLFLLLWRMTDSTWRSAFVAAIFAIHPLRAESVVWIEERKDVLSGVFFMLTLAAYVYYTRKPSIARYLTTLVLLAAGLLSKPMLVTTPVILLLLDYWPLGRWQGAGSKERRAKSEEPSVKGKSVSTSDQWSVVNCLVVEKIPLFVVAAIGAFLSSRGIALAHSDADQLPLLARIGNAFVSYIVYIWQLIWPVKLGVFYPYPPNGLPLWQPIAAAAVLIAITVLVFALRKSRPYLFVGWLWYVAMLAPVIGIVQINLQAHADRYTYLPTIGLFIAVTWLFADFVGSRFNVGRLPAVALAKEGWAFGVCFVLVIASLAITARAQVSYWRDSETLWSHTISVTKDNYFAHASLADLLMRRGRVNEAIEHSQEALRIRPNDANAQNNLGLALLQTGDAKGAAAHLEKALEIDPGLMNAEVNLAWVLATSSNDSLRNGARAVQLAEDVANRAGHPNAIVLRTLAAAYAETGGFDNAITIAQQAIQIARATGDEGLISDLERNIAAYQSNQPIRSKP
jgi:tetratricopeptide (TPR) repeat protein